MSMKNTVKKISLIKITEERLQCAICSYLVVGPLQFNCGHRICTSCARQLKQERYKRSIRCYTIRCMHSLAGLTLLRIRRSLIVIVEEAYQAGYW